MQCSQRLFFVARGVNVNLADLVQWSITVLSTFEAVRLKRLIPVDKVLAGESDRCRSGSRSVPKQAIIWIKT